MDFGTLWIGRELGPFEWMCLSSFAEFDHRVLVYSYDPALSVPDGCVLKDAGEIVPVDKLFENPWKPGSYALFSNVFRYELLRKTPLTWTDADVLCLSDFREVKGPLLGLEEPLKVNGAVLGGGLPEALIQFLCSESWTRSSSANRWGSLGPLLLSEAVEKFQLWDTVLQPRLIYPIHYNQVWRLFDSGSRDWAENKVSKSLTVHIWNEYLTRSRLKVKDFQPPPSSFLGARIGRNPVALQSFVLHKELPGNAATEWSRDLETPKNYLRRLLLWVIELVIAVSPSTLRTLVYRWKLRVGL